MLALHLRHWRPDTRLGTALLIHGMGGSSLHWLSIAENLRQLGYHVIAPDLSGHGISPRAERYMVDTWITEVMAAVEGEHIDLIMGHSLGGVIAAGLSTQLPYEPARIVMIDPAWYFPPEPIGWFARRGLLTMRRYNAKTLHRSRPHWSGQQINAELRSLKNWDPASVRGLQKRACRAVLATYLTTHTNRTLLVKPPRSMLVNRRRSMALRRQGVQILNLPKFGHNLHRDDTDMFMRAIRRYILPQDQFFSGGIGAVIGREAKV